jgi:hypothetical protein
MNQAIPSVPFSIELAYTPTSDKLLDDPRVFAGICGTCGKDDYHFVYNVCKPTQYVGWADWYSMSYESVLLCSLECEILYKIRWCT